MKTLRNWIFALFFATTLGGVATGVMMPQTANAACSYPKILTIPPWYNGLLDESNGCNVKSPTDVAGTRKFIWQVVLNVIEMLLHIVGYVAVAFIIYGGFMYILSTGSSDKTASAKKTITNAIIGLVISLFSVAIVNLIAKAL